MTSLRGIHTYSHYFKNCYSLYKQGGNNTTKDIIRKILVISIVVLFFFINFTSTTYSLSISKPQRFNFEGNILYVGGGGPGNYTKIQDAINDANNGDTIYVYENRYYENLKVNKTVTLIGQNRENTIVDGSHANTHAISLVSDDIKIYGLTFFNDGGPNGELAVSISSNNCNISYCDVRSSSHNALGFGGASYNTIYNCLVNGGSDAIRLMSDYNQLINCEIYGNSRFGALIYGNNNLFLNCKVYNNGEAGIRMDGNANIFLGCDFYNNGIAFKIDESRDHQILNCKIHDNKEDGIKLWQFHPKNVTIKNCDIFNNKKVGIRIIQDTVKTTVDNCRIYNNSIGITLADDSLSNTVIDNTIYDNSNYGIYLYDSYQNTITNNYLTNNGIYVYADNNVIENNTVNGKPIVYLEDESDIVLDGDAAQIILVNCDSITIQDYEISNIEVGINLWKTHNCLITGNTLTSNSKYGIIGIVSNSNTITDNDISNNEYGIRFDWSTKNYIKGNKIKSNIFNGIYFKYSGNNTIISNKLSLNNYGIYLTELSNKNKVYHNNFIDNDNNAFDDSSVGNTWDDTDLGNFWSDYKEKYPDAKKIPSKGIWDTPYEIEGGSNKDNFPVINQWSNSVSIDIQGYKATYDNLLSLRLVERFPLLGRLLILLN